MKDTSSKESHFSILYYPFCKDHRGLSDMKEMWYMQIVMLAKEMCHFSRPRPWQVR